MWIETTNLRSVRQIYKDKITNKFSVCMEGSRDEEFRKSELSSDDVNQHEIKQLSDELQNQLVDVETYSVNDCVVVNTTTGKKYLQALVKAYLKYAGLTPPIHQKSRRHIVRRKKLLKYHCPVLTDLTSNLSYLTSDLSHLLNLTSTSQIRDWRWDRRDVVWKPRSTRFKSTSPRSERSER